MSKTEFELSDEERMVVEPTGEDIEVRIHNPEGGLLRVGAIAPDELNECTHPKNR